MLNVEGIWKKENLKIKALLFETKIKFILHNTTAGMPAPLVLAEVPAGSSVLWLSVVCLAVRFTSQAVSSQQETQTQDDREVGLLTFHSHYAGQIFQYTC